MRAYALMYTMAMFGKELFWCKKSFLGVLAA